MRIKTLAVGPLATNCYMLHEADRCAILDPGGDGDRLLKALSGHKGDAGPLILLTHAHFDHTASCAFLEVRMRVPVFVGAGDEALLKDPGWMKEFIPAGTAAPSDVRLLREGDEFKLGETVLTVMETPGHSPGSVSFYTPGHLFCGDLVFRDGVGRTDLPGGDQSKLLESIGRVLRFPEDTVIHPGHGPSTTVGHERRRFFGNGRDRPDALLG